MTTPEVKPSHAKAWTATVISLLGSLVPVIAQAADWLPEPYGVVLSGVLMIFTALTGTGTYVAKYRPTGTVLVPAEVATDSPQVVAPTEFKNPYKEQR